MAKWVKVKKLVFIKKNFSMCEKMGFPEFMS